MSESNNIGNGTAAGLIEYLDKLVEKGRATPGAITPLKTAFSKVIQSVDGVDWSKTEVSAIDVDDYVSRFANLTRGTYTDSSISVYKSRLNRVISWYLKFMEQPGWMPSISPRAPRKNSKATANPTALADDKSGEKPSEVGADRSGSERFEIVIGDGRKGLLIFPSDRTDADVRKLQKLVDFLKYTAVGDKDEQADEN